MSHAYCFSRDKSHCTSQVNVVLQCGGGLGTDEIAWSIFSVESLCTWRKTATDLSKHWIPRRLCTKESAAQYWIIPISVVPQQVFQSPAGNLTVAHLKNGISFQPAAMRVQFNIARSAIAMRERKSLYSSPAKTPAEDPDNDRLAPRPDILHIRC